MLKEIYKENIHNKNDFTIISFFTENYIKKADRLICSLNNFDLNYKIYKIPNIHFSKSIKGNDDVSYSQPSLILNSIEELNTSVLYVDVDMVFKEKSHKIFFFEKKRSILQFIIGLKIKITMHTSPLKLQLMEKFINFTKELTV